MRVRPLALILLVLVAADVSSGGGQAPSISDRLVGRARRNAPTPTATAPGVIAPGETRVGPGNVPPSSSWLRVGAQMGYILDGSGTIDDDFLASGRVEAGQLRFSDAQPENFIVPIISNIGSLGLAKSKTELEKGGKDLLTSTKGLSLGVAPYLTIGPSRARTTLYGSAGWKLNTGRDKTDTTKTVMLHQGRFSVGLGMDACIVEGAAMPVSLSVEPVYSRWNADRYNAIYGVSRGELLSLELTAILPLKSIGVLAQTNMASTMSPSWRIGLLLFSAPGGSEKGEVEMKAPCVTSVPGAQRDPNNPSSPPGAPAAETKPAPVTPPTP